jgi:hypothetical protein
MTQLAAPYGFNLGRAQQPAIRGASWTIVDVKKD